MFEFELIPASPVQACILGVLGHPARWRRRPRAPDGADALAAAAIAEKEDLQAPLGRQAPDVVRSHYTLDSIADRYNRHIGNSLLRPHRS